MTDYSELKRLAEAATPGPWTAYDTHGKRFIERVSNEDHVVCATPKKQWLKDSEFIAAANPAAVLALIAENERLASELSACTETPGGCEYWREAAKKRELERDQLKAEVEAFKETNSELSRLNTMRRNHLVNAKKAAGIGHDYDLVGAVEALRKDADKWQIVERAMARLKSDEQGAAIWSACSRILISVASDLNSVRSVVTEEGVTNGDVEIGDWRVTVERIDAAMSKEADQ